MNKLTNKFSEAGAKRAELYKGITHAVYTYPTKYEEGFIPSELADIKRICNYFNFVMDEEKFNDALYGITCMLSPENETIIYHCDVELALKAGVGYKINSAEWD